MVGSVNLILLGPPGAGKGTQAQGLTSKFSLVHLSSGDMLRAERSEGTDLGKSAQSFMDSGKLVPDELITEIVISRVRKELSGDKGVLLDGFPRTRGQAESLSKAMRKMDQKIDAVIDLQLDDDLIVARMAGRKSCPKCGRVYHTVANPPKHDNMCDDCDVELTQRADDTEEVVRNRLRVYHEQTAPLEDYYLAEGVLRKVDASEDIASVGEKVIAIVDKLIEK